MQFDKRRQTTGGATPSRPADAYDPWDSELSRSRAQSSERELILNDYRLKDSEYRHTDGQGHRWLDEETAPPLDMPRLRIYAKQVHEILRRFEFDADGAPTKESMHLIDLPSNPIPADEARYFDELIDNYKSWALAWADLTADAKMGR